MSLQSRCEFEATRFGRPVIKVHLRHAQKPPYQKSKITRWRMVAHYPKRPSPKSAIVPGVQFAAFCAPSTNLSATGHGTDPAPWRALRGLPFRTRCTDPPGAAES